MWTNLVFIHLWFVVGVVDYRVGSTLKLGGGRLEDYYRVSLARASQCCWTRNNFYS